MERWSGRVALVTGASSGIGAAIAKDLVKHGLKVVGIARRVERVEEYARELSSEKGKLYPLKADVSKEEDILSTFKWTTENLGGVDILINNAAVLTMIPLTNVKTEEFEHLFALNVIGLSLCTREVVKSMKERGVDDGHIININSVAGHYIANFPGIYPYTAAKHAVTALTEGLRRELVQQKSKIRVSSVSPGGVDTEMARGSIDQLPEGIFPEGTNIPLLEAEDVSNAVLYILGTPAHVQVHELTIRPVGETF